MPIAANAGYYAEIVREKAILRRLVDAGTRIVQFGYAGEGEVDDLVDQAQAEVYQVTDKRSSEDYAPLSDIMDGVLDEIEAIGNREAGLYGVPTGFADLDDLTNGLHAGQMIIVAARPAMGKALALDTPLPTPTGWTTMGEVRSATSCTTREGRPTRVVAATDVMPDRPCYEVVFSDGSTHRRGRRAPVAHRDPSRPQVQVGGRQPLQPRAQPADLRRRRHHRADRGHLDRSATTASQPRRAQRRAARGLVSRALPLPAYVLGAWLGDGHSASARITCETDEIPMYIEGYGLRRRRTTAAMLYSSSCPSGSRRQPASARTAAHGSSATDVPTAGRPRQRPAILRTLGVLNNKHIPRLPAGLRAAAARAAGRADGHRRHGRQGQSAPASSP